MTDKPATMNKTTLTPADVLFSKTQQKVLGLLYGKPDQTFFTNEIARWANMGKGSVVRELNRMNGAGLINISYIGNQTHYQANRQCPIYNELAGIVRKTFGISDVINTALQQQIEQIQWAFIYGSIAKNTASDDSDIDLMLIGDNISYSAVINALMPAEQTLARQINPVIYSPQELINKVNNDHHFIKRLLAQPHINLIGEMPAAIAAAETEKAQTAAQAINKESHNKE